MGLGAHGVGRCSKACAALSPRPGVKLGSGQQLWDGVACSAFSALPLTWTTDHSHRCNGSTKCYCRKAVALLEFYHLPACNRLPLTTPCLARLAPRLAALMPAMAPHRWLASSVRRRSRGRAGSKVAGRGGGGAAQCQPNVSSVTLAPHCAARLDRSEEGA